MHLRVIDYPAPFHVHSRSDPTTWRCTWIQFKANLHVKCVQIGSQLEFTQVQRRHIWGFLGLLDETLVG